TRSKGSKLAFTPTEHVWRTLWSESCVAPRGIGDVAGLSASPRSGRKGAVRAKGLGGWREGGPALGAGPDAVDRAGRGAVARLARGRGSAARPSRRTPPRRRRRQAGGLQPRRPARHGRLEPLPRSSQADLRSHRQLAPAPRPRLDRSRAGPD